jgi:hypothetical protein
VRGQLPQPLQQVGHREAGQIRDRDPLLERLERSPDVLGPAFLERRRADRDEQVRGVGLQAEDQVQRVAIGAYHGHAGEIGSQVDARNRLYRNGRKDHRDAWKDFFTAVENEVEGHRADCHDQIDSPIGVLGTQIVDQFLLVVGVGESHEIEVLGVEHH